MDIHSEFINSPNKYTVLLGVRRSGKTTALITYLINLLGNPEPQNIGLLSSSYSNIKNFMDQLAELLLSSEWEVSVNQSKTFMVVNFYGVQHRIFNAESKSKLDALLVDEYQDVEDLVTFIEFNNPPKVVLVGDHLTREIRKFPIFLLHL